MTDAELPEGEAVQDPTGKAQPTGDPPEKALADAIELSDTKYCSVAATVRPTAEITTSYEIVEV
jgi:uncharacterized OsmC-like protein